jgi:hypothetical protein
MSHAGSFDKSNDQDSKPLIVRPQVKKTFIKGVIALGVFSLFLQIASNVVNYLIFVALAMSLLGLFMLYKSGSKFLIGEENIVIKRPLGKSRTIEYNKIIDMSVAQGILAKKFDCGSLFLIMKEVRGGVNMMGGGNAERLEDIPKPNYIYDLISSRLGPFSRTPS